MELIYIKELSKSYGKTRVLDKLSVSYESGKIYGLVGENGAGKTTLFNCIMGVTDYDGEIRKSSRMAVGYMPAENFFYSLITGKEYLEFCIKAKGKKMDAEAIDSLNKIFQLPMERFALDYSTGMKKKLALMALLLQENDLYILDEPFNGVDLYGCIQLKRIIRELKDKGKTVIISSHLINTLHELCDEIDFLDNHTIRKRYIQASVDEIEQDILNRRNSNM
jgi:ABC-2 type transport system ATP-binding protein